MTGVDRQCRWPQQRRHSASDNQLELLLYIPPQLVYFDGHFTQVAILPGVVQIHWAQHYGRQKFAISGEFLRMEVVKFQKIIGPGDEIFLTLAFNSEKRKLSFAYESAAGKHASGRLVYGDPQ